MTYWPGSSSSSSGSKSGSKYWGQTTTRKRGGSSAKSREDAAEAARDFARARRFIAEHDDGGFMPSISAGAPGRVFRGVVPRAIRRIPGDFAHGAKQAAVTAPAGLYGMGRSMYQDVRDEPWSAMGLLSTIFAPIVVPAIAASKREAEGERSAIVHDVAVPMGISTYQTGRHPLRDPFATFTLGLAAANPVLGASMRATAGIRAVGAAAAGTSKVRAFTMGAKTRPVYVRVLTYEAPVGKPTKLKRVAKGKIRLYQQAAGTHLFTADQDMADTFDEGGASVGYVDVPRKKAKEFDGGDGIFELPEEIVATVKSYTPQRTRKMEATAQAFRSPIGIAAQKMMDKARARFPDSRMLSPFRGGLREKIRFEQQTNKRMLEAFAESTASELKSLGEDFSDAQQVALYVAGIAKKESNRGDTVTLNDHIRYHEQKIAEGVGSKVGHERWIAWLKEANQYLVNTPRGPRIRFKEFPELARAFVLVDKLAEHRTELWSDLGLLDPVRAQSRRSAAAQEIKYGRQLPDEPDGQLPLIEEVPIAALEEVTPAGLPEGVEGPEPTTEWVPAEIIANPFTEGQRIPEFPIRGSKPKEYEAGEYVPPPSSKEFVPGSLIHDYSAEVLRSGLMAPEFTTFVAESVVEAERFAALIRARGEIGSLAHFGDPSKHDVPVNIGALKEANPQYVAIFNKLERGDQLDATETRNLGVAYEFYRQRVFPEPMPKGEALPPGWAWIDQRDLGDLHKINPIIRSQGMKAALGGLDYINDASRIAFIYAKLGYIPSNLLGNVAMNFVQQGFFAPQRLRWASQIDNRLGKGKAAQIDRIMGLGISSLAAPATSQMHRVGTFIAGHYANIIDKVPRRAAFYHEARKMNYKTDKEINDLLDQASRGVKKAEDDLVQIQRQAREAIGDYERLGQIEKGVLRRIIFFYPWLKVSSRMTGRTMIEYPYKSAGITQVAELGAQYQQEEFGIPGMPAGFEGLIPLGGGNVADPRAVAIWSTPAELAESGAGIFQGNAPSAINFSNWTTPFWGALMAAATKTDAFGNPVAPGTSQARIMWNELVPQIPAWRAYQKAQWDAYERYKHLYPQRARDAWLQWSTPGWRGQVQTPMLQERYWEENP